ncbi:MAG: hypothetical protein WCK27_18490 [Verrucomicrobiota bacterium]
MNPSRGRTFPQPVGQQHGAKKKGHSACNAYYQSQRHAIAGTKLIQVPEPVSEAREPEQAENTAHYYGLPSIQVI